MTTFYICRHGQTENNKFHRLSGWSDSPLTNEGLSHVQASARKLRSVHLDAIYSSDLGRAFMTAYDISRAISFGGQIIRHRGLRENNYGEIAGMKIVDAEINYPGLHKTLDFVAPGGESLNQLQIRILANLESIAKSNEGKHVLLAVHDGVIKAIYAKFADKDLAELNAAYDYANDFVGVFTYSHGHPTSFEELV